MRMLMFLLAAFSCHGVLGGTPEEQLIERIRGGKPARVLFVGNSYSFQVPKAFATLAKSEGKKVVVEQVTKGGWTLAKHVKADDTLARIREGKWDVVVLQEQSQTPAFPRAQREKTMIPAAKGLVAEVRKAGAIPAMFVTWGRRDGDKQNAKAFPDDTMAAMQKRLDAGYKDAAEAAGGVVLVPVGPTWLKAKEAGKLDGLFSKDGSHPAKDGVYLSAAVFYVSFYGSPVKNATDGDRALAEIASETAE